MNLFKIFKEIEDADPEIMDRLNPRRSAIKNMTNFGSKVAIASLPLAIGSLFKKAYGATVPSNVASVLNLALKIEYLEAGFYNKALATNELIKTSDLPGFMLIQADENNHVAFLKELLGSQAISAPTFDYSGGSGSGTGYFEPVFADYDYFLILAQVFEDTGERTYKGGLPALLGQQMFLNAALNIHSVEGRHAAYVRYARHMSGSIIKPWITEKIDDINNPLTYPVYYDEDNTTQLGIDVNTVTPGFTTVAAATESFDEPLSAEAATSIINLFIKQ